MKTYYKNGNTKSEFLYYNKLHQESIQYYENGEIRFHENFRNEMLHGWQVSFYENGNVNSSYNMKNGNIVGLELFYFSNKKLADKNFYF